MRCCYLEKPIFKDVVIIGNGPSGICLSLMLDGWTPFLRSTQHPDEFLTARLEAAVAAADSADITSEYGLPLVHTDMLELAQGLDGRTTNPVSLLYDALMRPYADMGMDMPSSVQWRRTEHQIDHVVLGKGPPGGSWHSMDPHILTLSLASWMALPGLPFTTENIENLQSPSSAPLRATAQQVASYYESYVKHMELNNYFRSNVIVTQIRPVEERSSMMSLIPMGIQCQYNWVERVKNDFRDHQIICAVAQSRNKPLCNILTNNQDNQPRKKCIAGYLRTWMPRRCNKQGPSDVSSAASETKELIHEIFDPNEENISAENENVKQVEQRGRSLDVDDVCVDCQKERAHALVHGGGARINSFCRCQNNRENNYRRSTKKRKEENNDIIAEGNENNSKNGNTDNHKTNSINNSTLATNNNKNKQRPKWLVDIYDKSARVTTTYVCNTLVLANGAHDLPNKLSLHRPNNQNQGGNQQEQPPAEPHWLLHDVRSLEIELDLYIETKLSTTNHVDDIQRKIDPVLVVGAGLSAADAILATRKRNIPVLHVFRSKSSDLIKKLPENMYPEYHKIHQMMMQQSSVTPTTSPAYTPFPAQTISAFDAENNTITIMDQHTNLHTTHRVSFAAVLIGSRPDLGFLPPGYKLGKRKTLPVDSKTNTVNIDRRNHAVSGFEGLYALGPLAGDNFVRFLPGGCLAAVGDMYRKSAVTRLE